MSGKPPSSLQYVFGFLWRGALLGAGGGFLVALFTIQILATIVVAGIDRSGLTLLAVLAGTLLGIAAGYGAARLVGTEDPRGHIIVTGYIGFSIGSHIASVATFIFFLFGLAFIIGPIVGLVGGSAVAMAVALMVPHYRSSVTQSRFDHVMRWRATAIAFIIGFAIMLLLFRYVYGSWMPDYLAVWWIYGAIAVIGAFLSAGYIWFTFPFLTEWHAGFGRGSVARVQSGEDTDFISAGESA